MERSRVATGRVRRQQRREENLKKAFQQLQEEEMSGTESEDEMKSEAESNRRKALSPLERLREHGQKLQQQIETDDEMLAVLEKSVSDRANCRAKKDCLYGPRYHYFPFAITDKYRICLHGVENLDWFGRRKNYYHIRCFSHMVDVPALIPSKLKLNGGPERWPVMVQEWYQHQGRFDMDKVAAFLEDYDAYVAAAEKYSGRVDDWQQAHEQSCADKAETDCACPPKPTFPVKPLLANVFDGEKDARSLDEVLKHPGCRYVDHWVGDQFR